MPKCVAIIGCLDTKGDEVLYMKRILEEQGCRTHVIDTGVMGEPVFEADTLTRLLPRGRCRESRLLSRGWCGQQGLFS